MKVIRRSDIDFVAIHFNEAPEARSYLVKGLLVREDSDGNVIGLDILDASILFGQDELLTMGQACDLLGVSESTMRRWIKQGKVKYKKPDGKTYRFKKSDIVNKDG